jgi:hypothetical protein
VSGKPYVQWVAPTVWTTLALTIGTDGSSHGEMIGAGSLARLAEHHHREDQDG